MVIKISEIIGAIIPVPNKFLKRFFENNKTIFIKPNNLKQLKKGQRIIFYSSGENKGLYCESVIENIEVLKSSQIWGKYHDKLFLEKEEFDFYVSKSVIYKYENKKIKDFLVFILKDFLKYKKSIKPKVFIPLPGRYLTSNMYLDIK